MELLPTMRDVADELLNCFDAVSRRYQLKDETTTLSEKLALSIKILTPKVWEHEEVQLILLHYRKLTKIIVIEC